jgi:hypothetical protein
MRAGRRRGGALALAVAGLALVALALGPGTGEAAGPWRGQVVDAETDRPLAGVVVLAIWDRISPGIIHPSQRFHDVDEVVTDAQGRFVIPARSRDFLNPLVYLDGPRLVMFKAGYGEYRTRGLPRSMNIDGMRDEMEKRDVTFVLPSLKTPQERLNALPARPSGPRDAQVRRFLEAVSAERISLGLSPLRTD